MSRAVPFIQRSFTSDNVKVSVRLYYMQFWQLYHNRMLYESSVKCCLCVAILAFTFCSRVLFVFRGAVRGGKVRTILRARRWEGPPREKRDFYRGER